MKKNIFSLFALVAMIVALSACSPETNEKAGGFKIGDMAGEWLVTVDALDSDGETVLFEDPYGAGPFTINTYATTNDDTDKMWLQDPFWGVKMLVPITSLQDMTFSCDFTPYDLAGSGNAKIIKGKVTKNGGKNIHGKPVDSIEIIVEFDDNEDSDYFTYFRYKGIRYQGFTE